MSRILLQSVSVCPFAPDLPVIDLMFGPGGQLCIMYLTLDLRLGDRLT
ncbi:hypothetical protein SNE26_17860 [Mucilaginibacter sp. cycad4]|nr:hypothetical protein [Mucilaginibacter gossypii]WPU97894.1 hypothetical protein SNE26_17860 [Mucilaginibacter gossypii]